MGDPSGIGPEVIAKALSQVSLRRLAHFVLIGDQKIFQRYLKRSLAHVSFCDVPLKEKCLPGKSSRAGGEASLHFLEKAVDLLKYHGIDGLVTAPVCKKSVCAFQKNFSGHTEYLAEAFGIKKFDMMFHAPDLRTVIVSRHVPIAQMPALITSEAVFSTIELTHQALKNYFKLRSPRLAVLGLNPHAGESGNIGQEEIREIVPAIEQACKQGMKVEGPFSADTFFVPGRANQYDCVIAMYHDQGLMPIKSLHFKKVVNMTIGLPVKIKRMLRL